MRVISEISTVIHTAVFYLINHTLQWGYTHLKYHTRKKNISTAARRLNMHFEQDSSGEQREREPGTRFRSGNSKIFIESQNTVSESTFELINHHFETACMQKKKPHPLTPEATTTSGPPRVELDSTSNDFKSSKHSHYTAIRKPAGNTEQEFV